MDEAKDLRLVLVGKTGVGKSETANSILGERNRFKSSGQGESMTSECQAERTHRLGLSILLVDTPGLFDTNRAKREIESEIGKFVQLTLPGPHAVLFIISAADRFTDQEVRVVNTLQELFGAEIEKYIVIIVTHTEYWEEDGMTTEKFLDALPQEAKTILSDCVQRKRAVAFINRRLGCENDHQVTNLFNVVQEMLRKCELKFYAGELWKKAQAEKEEREREAIRRIEAKGREIKLKMETEARERMATMEKELRDQQQAHEREIKEQEKREENKRRAREEELRRELEQEHEERERAIADVAAALEVLLQWIRQLR